MGWPFAAFLMPFTWNDIWRGFLIPAVVSCLICILTTVRPLLPGWLARLNGALAFILAFAMGYWLLDLGPVLPKSHWHWLPHVVAVGGIAGALLTGQRIPKVWSSLTIVGVSAAAAWMLVPTWAKLTPILTCLYIGWAIAIAAAWLLLDCLAPRVSATVLLRLLVTSLLSGMGAVILGGSLRFGHILFVGWGALTGMALAGRWRGEHVLTGVVAPYVLLLVGTLHSAGINSTGALPLFVYALPPLVPLLPWLIPAWRIPLAKRAASD